VHIGNVFGRNKQIYFENSVTGFIEENKVRKEGSRYFLTDKGKLFADGIAGELFV
jgi:hypothetical protein